MRWSETNKKKCVWECDSSIPLNFISPKPSTTWEIKMPEWKQNVQIDG